MFVKVEGTTVLLVERGVYRQADLYERGGQLFAKLGTGYVYLKETGATSKDGVGFDVIEGDLDLYRDPFGKLYLTAAERRTLVARGPEGPIALPPD